jgi:hypothetical protein
MANVVIKYVVVLILLLIGLTGHAYCQQKNSVPAPPSLLSGKNWESIPLLVYREPDDHSSIITIRFRINSMGLLDTLEVEGGPQVQKDSLRSQLLRLNGKWKPQQNDGRPVTSKWMVLRWYVSGFYGAASGCEGARWNEMKAAYRREAGLFDCSGGLGKPYQCRTYVIEGTDYFLFPPFYSEIVH